MATALILGQDVDVTLELGVGGDGAGLADDLSALDVLAAGSTQQQTAVLTGPGLIHLLVEHLDAGDGGLLRLADTQDLNLGVDRQLAALNTAGDDGAATGDGEDVLDRHEEGLVHVTLGGRDVLVDRVHELLDLAGPLGVALQGLQRGDADDRRLVAVVVLGGQQLADLHLHQLEQLLILNHVGLVQRDQQGGNTDLTGEQHVLAGLGHGAVGGGDHQDGAVHLRGTGDHVLDVVGVTGGVHVRVVTVLGLVLDVRDVDGDTALALLGSLVDLVEGGEGVEVRVLVVQDLGDRGGQRRLAVVDVTDRSDVDVRLGPLELGLGHWCPPGTRVVLFVGSRLTHVSRTGCESVYGELLEILLVRVAPGAIPGHPGRVKRLSPLPRPRTLAAGYSPLALAMTSSATFLGTSA